MPDLETLCRVSTKGNRQASLRSWKCTPSAYGTSPGGGDAAAGGRRGAFPSRRRRGCTVFPRAKPGCKGFRRRQAAFILALQGAHLPSGAVLYNSLGGALNPSGRRSRSRTEPWQPRGVSPGGCLNPRGEAASTFGNTAKRRFLLKSPTPQMIRAAKKH